MTSERQGWSDTGDDKADAVSNREDDKGYSAHDAMEETDSDADETRDAWTEAQEEGRDEGGQWDDRDN